MGKVSVLESVTLDGVMQAPSGPDEDTSGRFTRGGWAPPYSDEVMGSVTPDPPARPGIGPPPLHRRRCLRSSQAGRYQDDDHRRGDRDLPPGRSDGGLMRATATIERLDELVG